MHPQDPYFEDFNEIFGGNTILDKEDTWNYSVFLRGLNHSLEEHSMKDNICGIINIK